MVDFIVEQAGAVELADVEVEVDKFAVVRQEVAWFFHPQIVSRKSPSKFTEWCLEMKLRFPDNLDELFMEIKTSFNNSGLALIDRQDFITLAEYAIYKHVEEISEA